MHLSVSLSIILLIYFHSVLTYCYPTPRLTNQYNCFSGILVIYLFFWGVGKSSTSFALNCSCCIHSTTKSTMGRGQVWLCWVVDVDRSEIMIFTATRKLASMFSMEETLPSGQMVVHTMMKNVHPYVSKYRRLKLAVMLSTCYLKQQKWGTCSTLG